MAHKSRRDGWRMGCGIGPQASLRDSRPFGVQPRVKTLGYFRLSLRRDSKAAAFPSSRHNFLGERRPGGNLFSDHEKMIFHRLPMIPRAGIATSSRSAIRLSGTPGASSITQWFGPAAGARKRGSMKLRTSSLIQSDHCGASAEPEPYLCSWASLWSYHGATRPR